MPDGVHWPPRARRSLRRWPASLLRSSGQGVSVGGTSAPRGVLFRQRRRRRVRRPKMADGIAPKRSQSWRGSPEVLADALLPFVSGPSWLKYGEDPRVPPRRREGKGKNWASVLEG